MGGIRRKLLLTLIIYCSGFASAVYALAPTSREGKSSTWDWKKLIPTSQSTECDSEDRTADKGKQSKSDISVGMVNTKIEQWLRFAEDKASSVGVMIKTKLAE